MEINITVKPTSVPIFIDPNETSLGLHHGKMPLGIILTNEARLRVRLDNSNNVQTSNVVQFRFLNNNSLTERVFIISNNAYNTLTFNHVSVPFIDRPLNNRETQVDVIIDSEYDILPTFVYGTTDFEQFKQSWSTSRLPFAYLDLNQIAFLVPVIDIDLVMSLDIDMTYKYFNDIISTFDKYVGLSYNANIAYNKNFHRQYFVKCDTNGPGIAYYGLSHIGISLPSMARALDITPTNWLMLHEIGHSYDFLFVSNYPSMMEVWNNILADRMQYHWMTDEQRQLDASVYENGNRDRVEQNITNQIANRTPFESYSFFQKLAVMTWIMNTCDGMAMLQDVNKGFRRIKTLNPHHYPPLTDWFVLLAHQYDFIPYFRLVNAEIISRQVMSFDKIIDMRTYQNILSKQHSVVYPIAQLITAHDLNTESNYTLMTPLQLEKLGVTRTIRIVCDIDDMSQIEGETLRVFDGARLVSTNIIADGAVDVVLSLGVYTLDAPRGKDKRYRLAVDNAYDNLYIIVKESTDTITLLYTPYVLSAIGNETCDILGRNFRYAAKLYVDFTTLRITLNVYLEAPMSGQTDFFSMVLHNSEGDVVMQHTLKGYGNTLGTFGADINEGYRLKLYHANADSGHLRFLDTTITQSETNYTLSDIHIAANDYSVAPIWMRIDERLKSDIMWLNKNRAMLTRENYVRDTIYRTMFYYDNNSAAHNNYRIQYNDYFPNHVKLNRKYRLYMTGHLFRNLAGFETDLTTTSLKTHNTYFKLFAYVPNTNLDEPYLAFQWTDTHGRIRLRHALKANTVNTQNVTWYFNLEEGAMIHMYLYDPRRYALFKDSDAQTPISWSNFVCLRVQNRQLIHDVDAPPMIVDIDNNIDDTIIEDTTPEPDTAPEPDITPEPTPDVQTNITLRLIIMAVGFAFVLYLLFFYLFYQATLPMNHHAN
ncbi:VEF [Operophtera brumata nucleopolyhedrovirus]|uniref:VEF n=1 Tax=Operophtera brumata nucleopolyhedrovirus TaxID=1046267 RepID=A0A2H4V004_9ABAC|nr:VEF [Operophtera brumata nucleopolyhedrovirus]AUA60360.1 VEF [Operophtera brumata nucleopolyhedrovirus]